MEKKGSKKKIVRELPPVGTKLTGKFFRKEYKAIIVKDKNSLSGRVVKFNGQPYASMTAAAKAITKQPTNGWRFWKF